MVFQNISLYLHGESKRGSRLHLYLIAFNAIVSDSENCQFSTQRRQCTKRPSFSGTIRYGFLVGLVSCMLCGHGSASESCGMRKPTTILCGGD